MATLGIDLGTTNCCIASYKDGNVEVIPNSIRERTTPSYIQIQDSVTIGKFAKDALTRCPGNVIYDVKYLIGKAFDDPFIKENVYSWPFSTVSRNNKVLIAVKNNGTTEYYTPEELSGLILHQMKQYAEEELNTVVENAVITVPTYFNDSQRQATIDAGKIAGFKEIKLINEPVAAAVAYGVENDIKNGSTILIFDFGGGTFDISIVKYNDNEYEVIAIDGDLNTGGNNIDQNLFNYYKNKLRDKYNTDISNNDRAINRLRYKCEEVKITLSTTNNAFIELPIVNIEEELSIEEFNNLNNDVFRKCLTVLDNCIEKANITNIDAVLLVGGSTRNEYIFNSLQNRFGNIIKKNINPDEAVAMGAAIIASKWKDDAYQNIKLTLISAHSLGLQLLHDYMGVIIPIYTQIPTSKTEECWIEPPGSRYTTLNIYSGEKKLAGDNHFLGCFTARNLSDGPNGEKLFVTFEVDENGILRVTAVDLEGKSNYLDITLDKGSLTPSEIQEIQEKIERRVKFNDDVQVRDITFDES